METRLLVRREAGWVAMPYVWNAEQTEARLKRAGELVSLTLVDAAGAREDAAYQVPDQNQCAGCHGSNLGHPRSAADRPQGQGTSTATSSISTRPAKR